MRAHLVLAALVLLSTAATTALADTAPPPAPSVRTAPLAVVGQPWIGRISLDGVKLLPRTTRAKIPPEGLDDVYWGSITDAATWRALVARDGRALGDAPAIDFAREAVVFVLHDTVASGGGITTKGWVRDRASGISRLNLTVEPALLELAFTSKQVLMVRVPIAELARVQLVANGIVLA